MFTVYYEYKFPVKNVGIVKCIVFKKISGSKLKKKSFTL